MNNLKKKISIALMLILSVVTIGQIAYARISNPIVPSERWLSPYMTGLAATSQAFSIGRFFNMEFNVSVNSTVDQLCYIQGGTQNGNVQMAIYGPLVTEDSIVGAPFVASTTSVAQSAGTINLPQCLSIGPVSLPAGRYYVGIQSDSASGTYMRQANQTQVVGWSGSFDTVYGNLPITTATTTTTSGSNVPGIRIRIVRP